MTALIRVDALLFRFLGCHVSCEEAELGSEVFSSSFFLLFFFFFFLINAFNYTSHQSRIKLSICICRGKSKITDTAPSFKRRNLPLYGDNFEQASSKLKITDTAPSFKRRNLPLYGDNFEQASSKWCPYCGCCRLAQSYLFSKQWSTFESFLGNLKQTQTIIINIIQYLQLIRQEFTEKVD